MAQGGQEADAHNEHAFAFDASGIDFVVLTHAHIDHSGLLPKLVAQGFKGPIYTTLATQDLLQVLLKEQDVKDQLAQVGFEVWPTATPKEFARYVQQQLNIWGQLIEQSKIEAQ